MNGMARYSRIFRVFVSSTFSDLKAEREALQDHVFPKLRDLCFQHNCRMTVAGITRHPEERWMEQIARSATQESWGYLRPCRNVLHDRDSKFCESFRSVLAAGGVKTILLPAKSPNLNAFAERWVRSVKQECLSRLILFGEASLWRVLTEYVAHYHRERNHQGKDNLLLFPKSTTKSKRSGSSLCCHHRLGGLLKYYARAA
jgi:hypothetical protein